MYFLCVFLLLSSLVSAFHFHDDFSQQHHQCHICLVKKQLNHSLNITVNTLEVIKPFIIEDIDITVKFDSLFFCHFQPRSPPSFLK